jgi:hypothetical protein
MSMSLSNFIPSAKRQSSPTKRPASAHVITGANNKLAFDPYFDLKKVESLSSIPLLSSLHKSESITTITVCPVSLNLSELLK